ncbi:PilN domain-containing protein [Nitrospirillum amazonense]|uniref:PilN domain-containing protein n=1 Tax=Nitrospirillum amazonense TaxID=28077 RepID=UPI0011AA682B|nr:PilN domain-containing protein [Nitrospirillum amazonense]
MALILDSQDVYTVDLPLPRGVGVDPWRQAAMLAHRYMPLKPELLAWDVVTVREGKDVVAQVSMVRRSVLAAARELAGRKAVAVTTAGLSPQPQFLRLDPVRLRRRAGRLLTLLAVAVFMLPVPPLLVVWTLDQQTAHMEQKLKILADDVKTVRALRNRLELLDKVLARSGGALTQPSRRALLDEVARDLPDAAWLQDFTLRADGMVLQVQGMEPEAVRARFQEDPLFTDVRVEPPTQPSAPFSLTFSVAQGKRAANDDGKGKQ